MKDIFLILKEQPKYFINILLNLFFNIFSSIFSVFSFLMLIPFLKILFSKNTEVNHTNYTFSNFNIATIFEKIIANYSKEKSLLLICILVIIIFFLKNLSRYLAVHFLAKVRTGIAANLRSRLYKKIIDLHILYFNDTKKGEIIAKFSSDIQEVEHGILMFLEIIFKEPISIIFTLVTLLLISPKLTLFVLIILPISAIIIGKIGKTLKQKSLHLQHINDGIITQVDETISINKIIKIFNAQKNFTHKFESQNTLHQNIGTQMIRKRDLASPMSEFLGICVVVIVLFFGGKMVLNGTSTLSAETFITFIVIFSQIISPAKSFSNAFYHIQKGRASYQRIVQLLEEKIAVENNQNPIFKNSFETNIVFKNVCFKYRDNDVLHHINLEITKGKKIALVGVSGSGKSTLVQLIPRFFDVTNGEILIDDIDIKNIDLENLHQLITYVPQQALLFNDSIENNITLGKNYTKTEIITACKNAFCFDFINDFAQKLETNIGTNGNKISGGEQQRLAMARAFLKNAPILILDEATAHLDSNSEKMIQQALLQLLENKTAIIIAHRLSTVQFVDEIIVLKNGKIVESGTHQELLLLNGNYKNLVDLQQL